MADLYIGTSGYDYPEWKGILYPHELPRDQFLTFYAEHFNALEINYTYYGMPDEYQMASMIKRSGGKLHFSVKAHQFLTHTITVSTWRDRAREFIKALYPLMQKNLLLSVLLQFPQSFHYAVDERKYLENLVTELGKDGFLPLVIEFRHNSWLNSRVQDGLRKRNIGWCICDLPELRYLPTCSPIITSPNTYLRFHGKNSATWYGTNSRDRYDYAYSDDELKKFIPIVQMLNKDSHIIQIYFNNHAKGHAVVNAQKMKILTETI